VRRDFGLGPIERRNLRWGLLFISPWLFGFLALGIFPILYTFYLSLTATPASASPSHRNGQLLTDGRRSGLLEIRVQHATTPPWLCRLAW